MFFFDAIVSDEQEPPLYKHRGLDLEPGLRLGDDPIQAPDPQPILIDRDHAITEGEQVEAGAGLLDVNGGVAGGNRSLERIVTASRLEPLGQRGQDRTRIAFHGHSGGEVAVEHVTVDVRVEELAGRCEPPAPRPDLTEAAAHREHDVTRPLDLAHERRRHPPEAVPQEQGVRLREHALPLDRGGHGSAEPFGQLHELFARAPGAVPGVEKRTAGVAKHVAVIGR